MSAAAPALVAPARGKRGTRQPPALDKESRAKLAARENEPCGLHHVMLRFYRVFEAQSEGEDLAMIGHLEDLAAAAVSAADQMRKDRARRAAEWRSGA